nr:hypothetical protein [Streptomyces sp. rh34]
MRSPSCRRARTITTGLICATPAPTGSVASAVPSRSLRDGENQEPPPAHREVHVLGDRSGSGDLDGTDTAPVRPWSPAGYRFGHAPSGDGNRHTFGGLSGAAFRLVPLLEAGGSADRPW